MQSMKMIREISPYCELLFVGFYVDTFDRSMDDQRIK